MSMEEYQWEKLLDASATKKLTDFSPDFGLKVRSRLSSGVAKEVELKIYTHDLRENLFISGPFNDWGKAKDMEPYRLVDTGNGFQKVVLDDGQLQHKTPYALLDNGVVKRDPASLYFDSEGNSVFWDFEDPDAYQFKHRRPGRSGKSVRILQTDLPGLVSHFRGSNGKLGHEMPKNELYRFIAQSGVVEKIAELGFNAIQFLPFSQAIDGDKWSFRYLVPFLYAINNSWGTPDDLALMIDTFHQNGISVLLDHVISHVPHQRFRLFSIPNRKIGIHRWTGASGESIFLGEETSWGTKRYQYHNDIVRRFIVQSGISYLKNYRIDGFRIDNVDGILRHGENGDGPERHGGRELLREIAAEVYAYDPHAYIHLESHYFHGDNAKQLVQGLGDDPKALGATAYTSSRETYFFHKDYMPKAANQISPWNLRHIIEEKEWGRSNSTVADFHNHDAAAGLMPMRATGSYAYDALTLNKSDLHYHAVGKIKVMEALISFGMEGRTLDLLQTFLLQTGTFEHDSTIHWWLDSSEAVKAMLNYKKEVNSIMSSKAFWPLYTNNRRYLNVDDPSKTLTIHRSDGENDYVVLINMAGHQLDDFVIPVVEKGEYRMILNSDKLDFAGTGQVDVADGLKTEKVDLFELHSHGLRLQTVPGYAVFVLNRV